MTTLMTAGASTGNKTEVGKFTCQSDNNQEGHVSEIKVRSVKQLARSAALKAAKDARRQSAYLLALTGPRKVGDVCFCGYWRETYTVVSINTQNPDHPSITVRWHEREDRAEHETTHCTRWDARGGDRIVKSMETLEIRDAQLRKELEALSNITAQNFRKSLGMNEQDAVDAMVKIKTELAAIAQELAGRAIEEDTL